MFSGTHTCSSVLLNTLLSSCSFPPTAADAMMVRGHEIMMTKKTKKVTKKKMDEMATPPAVVIQVEQDNAGHPRGETGAGSSYPATTRTTASRPSWNIVPHAQDMMLHPQLLVNQETANPELQSATSVITMDHPRLSWTGTVECFNPMLDMVAKEVCLVPHLQDELALSLASGLVGHKDNHDHDGSRTSSSWLSLLQQDPPLYTDDEMRRLCFLKEELGRLEKQRQHRLSLELLDQYDSLRQARQLLDISQQQIALQEGVSKFSACGTIVPPRRSDVDMLQVSDDGKTNVATFNPPFPASLKQSTSCASIVQPLLVEGEESSSDTSVERSCPSEEGSSKNHQGTTTSPQEDEPHHEAQVSATAIIPALIEQYSVRGLDMAPFPLKLHAVLANPRYHHVITWLSDGKSWRVIDAFLLERFVLSRYFSHTKYSSFMRQVNGWGFARRSCRRGPEKGKSYFHVDFVRDDPERCLSMLRRRRKAKKISPP